MNKLPFYLIDAFTSAPFTGNPAAVCPLELWPDDDLLQAMTIEHNQSETAFFVKTPSNSDATWPTYDLRWFTTGDGEIDLCGHATLASAHVIFEHIGHPLDEIVFHSRFSGELRVTRRDGWLTLDFPSWSPDPVSVTPAITQALGLTPLEAYAKRDYLFLLPDEEAVRSFRPDFGKLAKLDKRVCITAKGNSADFVSRFFNPNDSQPEDPVTGSAHSMLIPFWAARLGKTKMRARQLSARGGELLCELAANPEQAGKPATTHLRQPKEDRVLISGKARTYLTGEISL